MAQREIGERAVEPNSSVKERPLELLLSPVEQERLLGVFASICRQEGEAITAYNQARETLTQLESRRTHMENWLLGGGVDKERIERANEGNEESVYEIPFRGRIVL